MTDLQQLRNRVKAADIILTAADAGGLPEPHTMDLSSTRALRFHFSSYDDLAAWTTWAEASITGKPGSNLADRSVIYTADGVLFEEPVELVHADLNPVAVETVAPICTCGHRKASHIVFGNGCSASLAPGRSCQCLSFKPATEAVPA